MTLTKRIAIASLLVAIVLFAGIRLTQHQRHVSRLENLRDGSRELASRVTLASTKLDNAGTRYFKKVNALFDSLDRLSENGLGFIAVIRQKITSLIDDDSLTRAVESVPSSIAHDSAFKTEKEKFGARRQNANDQLTSFSATLGSILGNPFIAVEISGDEFRKMGFRIGSSEHDLKASFSALRQQAHALTEATLKKAALDQHNYDEIASRKFPFTLIQP